MKKKTNQPKIFEYYVLNACPTDKNVPVSVYSHLFKGPEIFLFVNAFCSKYGYLSELVSNDDDDYFLYYFLKNNKLIGCFEFTKCWAEDVMKMLDPDPFTQWGDVD